MSALAFAAGNRVPVIAQLVLADQDMVREVIHRFNEIGLACLGERAHIRGEKGIRWGGRPLKAVTWRHLLHVS